MAMRKDCDVRIQLPNSCDYSVGPEPNLFGGFPARTRMSPDRPSRNLLLDLFRRDSFVITVVPLHQIGTGFDPGAQACEASSLECSLQRAAQDFSQGHSVKDRQEETGLRSSGVCERDIGASGVPPVPSPLGFAVANEIYLHFGLFWHGGVTPVSEKIVGMQAKSDFPGASSTIFRRRVIYRDK